MRKNSYNVIFVYSLLVLDLLVNITDNLLLPTQVDSSIRKDINSVAFIIVIIQIFAILCVIIDLALHFFSISDKVRQFEWNHLPQASRGTYIPMLQRESLKLVIEKYWWSLLVGLSYLILTIILQIVRLDPDWQLDPNSNRRIKNLFRNEMSANLKMETNELSIGAELDKVDDHPYSDHPKRPETASLYYGTPNSNLLPIFVLLVHKLMSTCYYVSFVVVYRATPVQMVNRIFLNKSSNSGSSSLQGSKEKN